VVLLLWLLLGLPVEVKYSLVNIRLRVFEHHLHACIDPQIPWFRRLNTLDLSLRMVDEVAIIVVCDGREDCTIEKRLPSRGHSVDPQPRDLTQLGSATVSQLASWSASSEIKNQGGNWPCG
jgi:hypothetical protein